jgi:signal transduction histidine kinase
MGLRFKLASGFLIPLAITTLAIGLLQTAYTAQSTVDHLVSLGNLVVHQTFEEMRASRVATLQELHDREAFRNFLDSVLAFGEGVVSVRIEAPDGIAVIAEPRTMEGHRIGKAPSIKQLQASGSWLDTLRLLVNLRRSNLYEAGSFIEMNGRFAGSIEIELSTALLSDSVRRSLTITFYLIGLALILGSTVGMLMVGSILRSIRALTVGMEQLAVAQTSADVKVGSRDELGKLADRLNQLSRRIMADRRQWEHERGQLLSAVSSINDAVLLLDSTGRILFANPEALGRLGMQDAVAMGRSIDVVLGRDHPLVRLSAPAMHAKTELHNIPMALNGEEAPKFLVSLMATDLGAGNQGSLMVLRDASAVEDLEETLNFSRILARQGQLLSGIGHQLRNPLHAIGLELEVLSDEAPDGTPLNDRILSIRGEIERITHTVNALLRFIRFERLEPIQFSLNDLVREVGARQIGSRQQQITYDLNDAISLEGDRALIAEALENIISNAMEATADGGEVRVTTALVGDTGVEIVVVDGGGGIAPEHMASIFDFGFTTKPAGGGIGLPIAMRIIDLHHGTLSVTSRQGHGTTVRIVLPPKQAATPFTSLAA